jgi:hypothetical protein
MNYYEVQCAKNAQSITAEITLHAGGVLLYHSDTKLPSRDTTIGHTATYPSAAFPWVAVNSVTTLTVPITFARINQNNLKVYLGVFGTATAAYDIKITQTVLPGAAPTGPVALPFATAYTTLWPSQLARQTRRCTWISASRAARALAR